jgi:predicted CXXCH cytochrome family protein
MKLWLASIAAAAMMISGTAVAADAPAAPQVIKAKNGDVTFKHETHKALKCEKCHADAKGGKITFETKEKAHGLCVECHKAEKKGPTKCAECHKKA